MAVRDYREMYISTILTLGKDKGLEDNKIPRICVSNSIFGAISAIKGNQTLYVHLVEPIKV